MANLRLLALLVALLCGWRSSASAQDGAPPRANDLSKRGRFMASGRVGGFWSNDQATSYGSYATWTLYAHPALTYFVRDNLGIGGTLDGGWSKSSVYPAGSATSSELGGGVELVWNVPFAQRWSLMLRPAVGYAREWAEVTVGGSPYGDLGPTGGISSTAELPLSGGGRRLDYTLSYLRLSASLPFVYALTSQLGLGFGPDLRVDYVLTRERNATPLMSGALLRPIRTSSRGTRLQVGVSISLFVSF